MRPTVGSSSREVAAAGQRDIEAGPAGVADQLLHVAEAGLRGQRRVLVRVLLQHAEQLAQLLQRAAAGVLQLIGELADPVGVVGGHVDRAGLQHHEADPVTDHVVHLAGDPGPLGQHGLARPKLLLGLGPLGPLAQRGEQLGPGAYPEAEHRGQDQQHHDDQDVVDRLGVGPDRPRCQREQPGHR